MPYKGTVNIANFQILAVFELTFSYEALDQADGTYKKLKKRISAVNAEGEVAAETVKEWHDKFVAEVGNDMNTSMGITLVYDVLKADMNGATKLAVIEDYDKVLCLNLVGGQSENTDNAGDELTEYVESMIAKRAEAKKAKDFATADAIREELLGKGIVIKDTREGTTWERA